MSEVFVIESGLTSEEMWLLRENGIRNVSFAINTIKVNKANKQVNKTLQTVKCSPLMQGPFIRQEQLPNKQFHSSFLEL